VDQEYGEERADEQLARARVGAVVRAGRIGAGREVRRHDEERRRSPDNAQCDEQSVLSARQP
jgi:hypothetical protein